MDKPAPNKPEDNILKIWKQNNIKFNELTTADLNTDKFIHVIEEIILKMEQEKK